MFAETNNAKLFAKIAAVMGEVRTLEKTGRNTYDKYDYVTADTIATKIGAILAKHRIALLPSMISVDTSEYATQKGGNHFRTVCHFQITLACGDSGATWSSLWSGEAIDRSDKSISKAAVSALKYFLLKTFLLAGGDEDDADAHSPSVERPDAIFDATPPVASAEQLKQLNTLGKNFYNGEWAQRLPELVQAVSRGNVSNPQELTQIEIAKLIAGIERKMKETVTA